MNTASWLWHLKLGTAVLAVVTALFAPPTFASATIVIRQVTVTQEHEATRLQLDGSSVFKPKVFTLTAPYRLVIDIPNAELQSRRTLPPGNGLIRKLRTASYRGGLRIVADLESSARHTIAAVPGSKVFRLVVELTASGPPAQIKNKSEQTPAAPRPVKTETALAQVRDVVIAVDAGHGGEDPGAIGRRNTREKDVTLAIARELKQQIDNQPGMRAVLTRDGDYFIPLRGRIQRARQHQADLFVSIHADSHVDRSLSGSSVYVLSQHGATNEASRWLAERENAADLIGGISLENKDAVLASVLLDLSQGASMSASMEAAGKVLQQLDSVGNVHRAQVQQAGFVVLKSPDIPSMLVETAFISNPMEELRLGQHEHQKRLAAAIGAGLRQYFIDNPPPGTQLAQLRNQSTAAVSLPTEDVASLGPAPTRR